jgi:hypothetical protein
MNNEGYLYYSFINTTKSYLSTLIISISIIAVDWNSKKLAMIEKIVAAIFTMMLQNTSNT